MPELTKEQGNTLHHTVYRAAGGYYCGETKTVRELVEMGLMEYAGRKSFVPDPYFKATAAGREALKEAIRDGRIASEPRYMS